MDNNKNENQSFTYVNTYDYNKDNIQRIEVSAKDCEEALLKIDSGKKFQKLAFFLLTICYTCTGACIGDSFGFLEKDPPITCSYGNFTSIKNFSLSSNDGIKTNDTVKEWSCLRNEACSIENKNNNNFKYEFHYKNRSFSWTNDFQLDCNHNSQIFLFLFLLGSLISSVIASPSSDYLGRSELIKYAMAFRTITVLLIILSKNLNIIYICVFCIGVLNSILSTVPYILLSEYLSNTHRDKYLTLMLIFDSISGLLSTLIFYFLQNWIIFFLINLFYGAIFFLFFYMVYESPRFLHANKRYDEARDILRKISRFNIEKDIIFCFESESELRESVVTINYMQMQKINLNYIFKNKSFRFYIFALPMICFFDSFSFISINFLIEYIDADIYLLNTIIFTSEIFSYLFSILFIKIFGKRNTMIIFFLFSSFFFISFYVLDLLGYLKTHILYHILLTFFAKFGVSVVLNVSSIYTNESFPTVVRGRATGLCHFLSKVGAILSLISVKITYDTAIVSGIFCFLAFLFLIPMDYREKNLDFIDYNEESIDNNPAIEEGFLKYSIYKSIIPVEPPPVLY